ncbi:hypothetical protein M3Y97_00115700 [Aphelenchoides bicaudatus]|nr:hypothetical protein M3Y97_00115700 [Aphelenchoides bicaudatus]
MDSWPAPPLTSTAIDRVVKLLDPEDSVAENEYGQLLHMDMASCASACVDILFTCVPREEKDGFICAMDTTMLLLVVIAAILTGFLIPISCIVFCLCTRFCGMFDDEKHTEAQGLIHSDLRQDWDTYPSSTDCPPQQQPTVYSQNENSHCSSGSMPLYLNDSPDHYRPPIDVDEPYSNTIISSTDM